MRVLHRPAGHGVRIIDDITVAETALSSSASWRRTSATSGSPLEMCPWSNVQTGAAASIAEHPIGLLKKLRFRVTLNTDNRLMSKTSMTHEMWSLVEAFDYGLSDLEWFTINAMKSAFLPFDERFAMISRPDQARLRRPARGNLGDGSTPCRRCSCSVPACCCCWSRAALFLKGVRVRRAAETFRNRAVEITATVVGLEAKDISLGSAPDTRYFAMVRFVPQGAQEPVEALTLTDVPAPPPRVDEEIRVVYDPERPERVDVVATADDVEGAGRTWNVLARWPSSWPSRDAGRLADPQLHRLDGVMPGPAESLFWISLCAVLAPLVVGLAPRQLVPEVVVLLVLGRRDRSPRPRPGRHRRGDRDAARARSRHAVPARRLRDRGRRAGRPRRSAGARHVAGRVSRSRWAWSR